jgi:glucosamine kinase
MMDHVLGLDSGGTKTLAVVADRSGRVVAAANGEGLDPTAHDQWQARLAAMIAPFGPVVAATLGLPFHGEIAEISAQQQAVAKSLVGEQAQVVNDVAVAFEGALAGQDGILILAGTGSMAWARGRHGTVRVGGWGDAFGDEGSAYWIGREALGLVSQHLDGRADSPAFADGILAGACFHCCRRNACFGFGHSR